MEQWTRRCSQALCCTGIFFSALGIVPPPVILGGLGARTFGDAFSAFQLPSMLAGEER